MKFCPCNLGLVRGLLALSVSLAVVTSSHAFAFASFSALASSRTPNSREQVEPLQGDEGLLFADAVVTEAGVRLEWRSNFEIDNLGFNVYRLKGGKRTRINREIIPGSVFAAGPNAPQNLRSRGGQSYSWFDPAGTADSVYYIESVSVHRVSRLHEPLTPVSQDQAPGTKQIPPLHDVHPQTSEIASADASDDTGSYETSYPAGYPAGASPQISASLIEDQWTIAAQPGLKIAIKKDGWYRVTQPQMAAAGFNPSVDIRNLQLFVGGLEVAISTSQSGGLFGPADYFEFFGRGLDVPSSDVRTYYLIAATSPGKRVRGEIQVDSAPSPSPTPLPSPSPSPSPATGPAPKSTWSVWLWRTLAISAGYPIGMPVAPLIVWRGEAKPDNTIDNSPDNSRTDPAKPAASEASETGATPAESKSTSPGEKPEKPAKPLGPVLPVRTGSRPGSPRGQPAWGGSSDRVTSVACLSEPALAREARLDVHADVDVGVAAAGAPAAQVVRKKKTSRQNSRRKRKKNRLKQERAEPRREYSHPLGASAVAVAPSNFEYTVERKDRGVYFSSLLNGATENWFGQVIATTPATQTINTPNPALSAPGPARLEIKLQGANFVTHQVSVKFNDVAVGSFTFFGLEGPSQVLNVPVSLLQNGANTIKFTPAASGDVSIVDYARLTYPHTFRADADALKFSLLGTQTLQVDGFSNQNVRLLDYTDPLNVRVIKPLIESNVGGSGYAITVPVSSPKSKTQRLFYAAAGAAEQPAALSLNQPSTLNTATNAADFLIVTTNSLTPSLAPLVAARQAQGMTVAVVDVEDIYDEFGYGVHGPQAVKDFLSRAATIWATKPRYVIFAGDATYDPRNYLGIGNFDLVPTKLVDATFNETASDDWLADFDDDGIADIPVGRLPVRISAEADLVVSKIVNYAPANVPQAALLVADNPGTPPVWDFEVSNDNVQALLPASMTVQRINIRTEPSNAQATADIIAGLNQGRVIVNYSGHGNVNVWSGAAIFTTANATALTNGNKLSFVVVMDCLNGYYHAPALLSLSEAFLMAPGGGAVAAFASSGLTTTFGQRQMELQLYSSLYGGAPIALGDAIKIAKAASGDIDVRRTWIFFGDPSMKIR